MTLFQGRNRDTDIENEWVEVGEGRKSQVSWEFGSDVYAPPCVRQIAGTRCREQAAPLAALWWLRGVDGG